MSHVLSIGLPGQPSTVLISAFLLIYICAYSMGNRFLYHVHGLSSRLFCYFPASFYFLLPSVHELTILSRC
jgi:hypothetical protein